MKLRTKIIAGFLTVAVIGWLVGIAGQISIRRISSLTKEQDLIRLSYIDAAEVMDAHFEWRQLLTQAVYSGQEFKGSTNSSTCSLGKWLASDSSKIDDDEIKYLIREIGEPHDYVHSAAKKINDLLLNGEHDAAIRMFEDEVLPQTGVTISLIDEIEERCSFLLAEKMDEIFHTQTIATWLIATLLIMAVVLSVLLAYFIIRSIMRPIQQITGCAETLATGHLDIEVDYNIEDEIGLLANTFINLSYTMKEQARVLEALS